MCMMKGGDEEEAMILREKRIKKMEKIKIAPKVFLDDRNWGGIYSEEQRK
jgi:glutaredoxin